MGFYRVVSGGNPQASDLNQFIDALTGQADAGALSLLAQISPPGAPAVAVNASAGNLNGTYTYKVTFVTGFRRSDGVLVYTGETQGGTTSAAVSPVSQQVNLANIPIGPTGVIARRVYRTAAGGADGTQKLAFEIPDNTTTSWTDNVADANLGAAVPTTNTTGTKISLPGGLSQQLDVSHTIDDTTAPTGNTGKAHELFNRVANRLKTITGQSNWITAPVKTIAQLWALFDGSTGHEHTGAVGDAPKIDPTTGLTYVPVNKAGDTMTGPLAVDAGGGALSLKPGSADHVYISFFADSQAPTTRSGCIGYPGAGLTALTINNESAGPLDLITLASQPVRVNGYTVWHAGNDGAGSGLDADLLDGLHASDIAGAKIINLLPFVQVGSSSTTAGDSIVNVNGTTLSTFDLANLKFLFQSAFSVARSVYFEAVLSINGSATAYASLRDSTGTRYGEISTTSTAAVRIRSGPLSLPDNTELYLSLWSSSSSVGAIMHAARLVIV